jgi:hypothetical protein
MTAVSFAVGVKNNDRGNEAQYRSHDLPNRVSDQIKHMSDFLAR